MAIRDIQFPASPRQENFELALANRKLTTALLGMVLLAGLIACMSYLAGRSVSNIQANSAAASVPAANAPQPVIVEPLAKSTAAPAVIEPRSSAVALPAAAPQTMVLKQATNVPPRGSIFMQVGYIDPAQSASFTAALRAKGFSPQLLPAEGGGMRVLLGPVASEAEALAMQSKLTANGIESFVKRF